MVILPGSCDKNRSVAAVRKSAIQVVPRHGRTTRLTPLSTPRVLDPHELLIDIYGIEQDLMPAAHGALHADDAVAVRGVAAGAPGEAEQDGPVLQRGERSLERERNEGRT
jgi:hypothetical protein